MDKLPNLKNAITDFIERNSPGKRLKSEFDKAE